MAKSDEKRGKLRKRVPANFRVTKKGKEGRI